MRCQSVVNPGPCGDVWSADQADGSQAGLAAGDVLVHLQRAGQVHQAHGRLRHGRDAGHLGWTRRYGSPLLTRHLIRHLECVGSSHDFRMSQHVPFCVPTGPLGIAKAVGHPRPIFSHEPPVKALRELAARAFRKGGTCVLPPSDATQAHYWADETGDAEWCCLCCLLLYVWCYSGPRALHAPHGSRHARGAYDKSFSLFPPSVSSLPRSMMDTVVRLW